MKKMRIKKLKTGESLFIMPLKVFIANSEFSIMKYYRKMIPIAINYQLEEE